MATIIETKLDVSDKGDGSALAVVWTPLTNADTCRAFQAPAYSARSIQASGTFGSATVVLNGSNTGTNFFGLNNLAGSAVSITSEAIKQCQDTVRYYQPAFSGGDGTQSLTVTMLFTRAPTPRS